MIEENKVTEAPVTETPKATDDASLIDNRRTQIENLVITENATVPEREIESSEEIPDVKKEEVKKEEVKAEEDPLDRIKKSVQKRIDKVVAQKKSAEEELSEARAEIERLKSTPKQQDSIPKDDTPPTPDQVEAYIIKMREEGNLKDEIAATRYLIKLEKELAIKEVEERQTKVQKEADAEKSKQLADWTALSKDYVAYDANGKVDVKSDLTLNNQNGLLYKTALSLYNDKELHADFYNDSNVILGFRRAVADAYREIHQQGLITNPRGEEISEVKRNPRFQLGDPSADTVEETVTQSNNSASLSDADKVREEIKARKNNRFKR